MLKYNFKIVLFVFYNIWFQEYKMERDGVGMGVAYNEASDKEGYFFFRVKDVSK